MTTIQMNFIPFSQLIQISMNKNTQHKNLLAHLRTDRDQFHTMNPLSFDKSFVPAQRESEQIKPN